MIARVRGVIAASIAFPIDLFDTRTRRPDQQMLPGVARVPALAEQASALLNELCR